VDIHPQAAPELAKLAERLGQIEIGMLTTQNVDGTLRSRPLRTLQMDVEGALWFMTTISSPKIGEIDEHRRVSLSYCRPARETYVWVFGITQILRDEAKARELWTPALRPWLAGGIDDPEVVLLKVTVEEAEYWDAHRRAVLPLYPAAHRSDHERIQNPRSSP
jgi:general stress protein 26